MKKRYDVFYTVAVRETTEKCRTIRWNKKKTNNRTGEYNTIQLGRNLKFKDALEIIAGYNMVDGFFSVFYNDREVFFGGRHNTHIDLTNSSNAYQTYRFELIDPEFLHPTVEL